MNKIALFNHKLITPVFRFEIQSAVVDKITAERTARASGRGIFRNVVRGRKETRVRTRRANLERLARERMTTGATVPRVDVCQQTRIDLAIAQVSQRTDRHDETRQACSDHLNRQSLVEILTRESERACEFGLFVTVVDLVNDFKLALRHDDLDRLAVLVSNFDRQHADSDFVKDALPAAAAFGRWSHASRRECGPATDV